jgi:hypothetical protein
MLVLHLVPPQNNKDRAKYCHRRHEQNQNTDIEIPDEERVVSTSERGLAHGTLGERIGTNQQQGE